MDWLRILVLLVSLLLLVRVLWRDKWFERTTYDKIQLPDTQRRLQWRLRKYIRPNSWETYFAPRFETYLGKKMFRFRVRWLFRKCIDEMVEKELEHPFSDAARYFAYMQVDDWIERMQIPR